MIFYTKLRLLDFNIILSNVNVLMYIELSLTSDQAWPSDINCLGMVSKKLENKKK